MKINPVEKVLALRGKGWTIAEISEEIGVGIDRVRSVIIGNWAEEKKKQSVADKVAGRFGKSYFNR